MMKQIFATIFLAMMSLTIFAQTDGVSINNTGNDPDASAILDVQSTSKGMLIPRMDSTSRKAVISPAEGLMVYDSTTQSFWFFSSQWREVNASNRLSDADKDTKIEVESNPDEDRIRLTANGNESLQITYNGMYAPGTFDGNSDIPVSGPGPRMMWVPGLAAFRVGQATGTKWDANNLPFNSSVLGGSGNEASGIAQASTIAGGLGNTITGPEAFIGGGQGHNLTGERASIVGGLSNDAFGIESFIGNGKNNLASGLRSTVTGGQGNTASGDYSLAAGVGSIAPSYGEIVMGLSPEVYTPVSDSTFEGQDRLFVIGNGENGTLKSNALTILKNGRTGLGISDPVENLELEGAIKLGNTDSMNHGTVRYTGQDFEGYLGGKWYSLTGNLERAGQLIYELGEASLDANHQPAGALYISIAQHTWQSFTAEKSGYLTRVDFLFSGTAYLTYTYKIYEGEGTGGNLLKVGTIPASFNGWNTFFNISDKSIPVTAGKKYTIEFIKTSNGGSVGWRFGPNASGGYYSGGSGSYGFKTFVDPEIRAMEIDTAANTISLLNNTITIKEEKVGINTTTPQNSLDVEGGLAIGANYSGSTAAPSNGAIIEGQVGIGTVAPAYDLDVNGTIRFGGFNTQDQDEWPRVVWAMDPTNGWDEGLIKVSSTHGSGDFNRAGFGIHMSAARQFGFWSSGWDQLFSVQGGTGDTYIKGNVGIGTTNPTKAKLEINGSVNFDPNNIGYLNAAGNTGSYNPGVWPYSIYASNVISGQEFHAHSDRRIKNILGVSDSETDLTTLMKIKVTDYHLRDSISKGNRNIKKVIAQQVAEVYPQAVTTNLTEVVPDIYQRAEVKDGWIMLATDLKIGERVKLITEKSSEIYEVLAVGKDGFQVKDMPLAPVCFVYGREVNDFHTVDYEAISMLNVSATQEQQRIIDRQQVEIEVLKEKLAKIQILETRLQSLEALLETGQ